MIYYEQNTWLKNKKNSLVFVFYMFFSGKNKSDITGVIRLIVTGLLDHYESTKNSVV